MRNRGLAPVTVAWWLQSDEQPGDVMKNKESPYKSLWIREHTGGSFPIMEYDPEVREHALECLKTMTFVTAAETSAEKFGGDRGVSKSSLHRYWLKHKKSIVDSWAAQTTSEAP